MCAQLKALLNALYFGADHVVWASQAGLTTNKALVDRAQKVGARFGTDGFGWLRRHKSQQRL
jgi:Peroxisomal biogenesis factor 11 (PEX11)